jgi:LacI family transcriptional regulator
VAGRPEIGIKDVARRAGVSVGTVSNVLNRPDVVSAHRRNAVQQAIAELGYVPNRAARQLKVGESTVIGFVSLDTTNPFYTELLTGAEEAAEALGLTILLTSSHTDPSRQRRQLEMFEQQRVRGVLVTPVGTDTATMRTLQAHGTPILLVDAQADEHFCSVATDDLEGGRLAVQHLIDLGRRRIAVVGHRPGLPQVAHRYRGAREAVSKTPGVRLQFLPSKAMTILEGRRIGEQVADMTPSERPDAIFATNDLLAIGLLQALTMNHHVRVPDEIAIIGYDDIDFCASAVVPLSSIRQPGREIGVDAVTLLEEERQHGLDHVHRSVLLVPQLVARASTTGRDT